RTIRAASSRSSANASVAWLPGSFTLNAPPSAVEATKSTLLRILMPCWSARHERVFSASYFFAPPHPAASRPTSTARTRSAHLTASDSSTALGSSLRGGGRHDGRRRERL